MSDHGTAGKRGEEFFELAAASTVVVDRRAVPLKLIGRHRDRDVPGDQLRMVQEGARPATVTAAAPLLAWCVGDVQRQ
jgi:hypothetical protein